ncbi:Phage portal protein, SPP1 Gp6 [Clostridium perfringens]|uniref:Phage portal protein, SPP1 Gp6 n=2 Tax=Clostridium perfringens TaxID=1502 RepID=A0A2X3IGU8_CLOPF|nr:Phage portal protein, SPP1 Gp6 [Clostridium perfringens]
MKEKGIIILPGDKSKAEWLIKNINDSFIQNTINTYEDKIYQIACHINANEKMQSNTSSLALRARLNAMENKCSLNQNAHKDIIKNRIRFICKFLKTKGKDYDPKDINIKYTANIPQDDLMIAQILAQVPEGTISKETARSQFSFIANSLVEAERVAKEQKEEIDKHPDLPGGGEDE